jgi:TusA-related sulfurtransferase
MEQDSAVKPNVILDLTGLTCPAPLLGAKRVLDDLKPGEVLMLISDCPGTREDLFSWVRYTDNEIVEARGPETGRKEYLIRKGKRPIYTANVTLDMRGVSCPGPIIEACKVLGGMAKGEILRLVSNCPASRSEVKTWAEATGNRLRGTREIESAVWEFYIQQG